MIGDQGSTVAAVVDPAGQNDAEWVRHRERSASAGAGVSTVLTYLAQAMALISIPLYLRWLGQEQYGVMLLLVTLQSYLCQSNLGLNWAAMNMVGAARANRDETELVAVVQNALLLAAITGVVALVASVVLAMASQGGLAAVLQASDGVSPWAIISVGCLAAVSLGGGPIYLTFVALSQSSIAALYQGLARVLSIPAMLWMAWSGSGIAGMFFVSALVQIVLLAVATFHLTSVLPAVVHSGPYFSRAHCVKQFQMGIKNLMTELGFLLHATAPMIALGATCGAKMVPLYVVPKALLDTAFTFGRSQFSVLQPAYAEAARLGRTAVLSRMLGQSITRNLASLGILSAGFIVLCGPFVSLWMENPLEITRATAVAIAVSASASFLLQLLQLFLVSVDRQRLAAVTLATTGAITFLLAFVAGWVGGFVAVLYCVAVSGVLTVGLFSARTMVKLEFGFPVWRGVQQGAIFGAIVLITLFLGLSSYDQFSHSLSQAFAIVLTGLLMVACYAMCLYGWGRLRTQ